MIGHVIGILLGLLILFDGVVTLVKRARLRAWLRTAPGVFVGREDVIGSRPAVQSRSGRFRFTTEEGRVIEATSSFYSFPGPKPGRPVTIANAAGL
jgi:hypothetical protein